MRSLTGDSGDDGVDLLANGSVRLRRSQGALSGTLQRPRRLGRARTRLQFSVSIGDLVDLSHTVDNTHLFASNKLILTCPPVNTEPSPCFLPLDQRPQNLLPSA